jgi:hypothetical protein
VASRESLDCFKAAERDCAANVQLRFQPTASRREPLHDCSNVQVSVRYANQTIVRPNVDNPAIPSQAQSVRASVIDGSFKRLRREGNSHQSEQPAIQQFGWVSTGKDGLNLFYGVLDGQIVCDRP